MSIGTSNASRILTVRNTALKPSELNGKPVLRATENETASPTDPILVSRSDDGWAPVEKLEGSLGRDELSANFALWKDEPEYEFSFWRRPKKLNDGDGQVQPGEIKKFEPAYERGLWPLKEGAEDSQKRTFPSTNGYAGGEIVTNEQGSEIREVAYYCASGYPYHNEFIGESIRSLDSHWLINK